MEHGVRGIDTGAGLWFGYPLGRSGPVVRWTCDYACYQPVGSELIPHMSREPGRPPRLGPGIGLRVGRCRRALEAEELLAALKRVAGDVVPREGRADVDRPRVPPEEP